MAERITRADVDRIADTVSRDLPDDLEIRVGRRNGYTAVDLSTVGASTVIRLLTMGTSREVYTYLQGMRQAQLLERFGT
jgi:hypothetical protein